jgi:SAM-dependent methyltransferase
LEWLNVPPNSHWLDVGCGTGALSQTILDTAAPNTVKGIDRPDGFAAYARIKIRDERAQFEVGDAQALPVETGAYDAVVSGLAFNFFPQSVRAVAEMRRTARSNGVVAAYVWDYAGKMQMMRHFWDAAAALDPIAYDLDEGRRFPLSQPSPLGELFHSAGLGEVAVCPIEIAMDFINFDDFWSPFLGGQGPAPGYVMSLSPDQRMALQERIRAGLPFALDGSIPLRARAWAVKGIRT